MCLCDFNGHVGRCVDVFVGVHRGYGVGERNFEGRLLLVFCLKKELCVSTMWIRREERRKVTLRLGDMTDIYCVLIRKEHQLFLAKCKGFPCRVLAWR